MTLTFDWFLPTSGDGRTIYGRGHSLPIAQAQALPIPGDRPPDIEYLGQVARAAEQLGFRASVTLEQGMSVLIDWLADQEAVDKVDAATDELVARGLAR